MKKYGFLILGLLWLSISCVAVEKKQSVCETITEPSYLCEIADRHGVAVEDIGAVLVVSNAVAIGEGAYSVEDALRVLRGFRKVLDNPVSYIFMRSKVKEQLARHPGLFLAADMYLAEFKSPQIMHDLDRAVLRSWLEKQIRSLGALNNLDDTF